jgi:hypothetical protein
MTRTRWIVLVAAAGPVLAGATITSATLGPLGALAYGALLLAGINTRHLFRTHRNDHHTSPIRIIRERFHR